MLHNSSYRVELAMLPGSTDIANLVNSKVGLEYGLYFLIMYFRRKLQSQGEYFLFQPDDFVLARPTVNQPIRVLIETLVRLGQCEGGWRN